MHTGHRMHLQALSHAVPAHVFRQPEVWDILRASSHAKSLKPRSQSLLEKVLLGPSGIDSRHIGIDDPAKLFAMDAGELNAYFEHAAPLLASQALGKALNSSGHTPADIDALFLCSCTGYLCPGPTSHVAELSGLRPDCYLADMIGLGCGAAIPALRAASHYLAAHPEATVAVIAVEICSAAFYLNDDPAVLISLCLFGDAASASIWSNTPSTLGSLTDFRTLHLPEHREKIRFTNDRGFLRNQLDRAVPQLAAKAVSDMAREYSQDISSLICHPGGRDIIDAIEAEIPQHPQTASRHVLRHYGNCSSPSVLLALEHDLVIRTDAKQRLLASFGAGFACHTAAFDSVPANLPVRHPQHAHIQVQV